MTNYAVIVDVMLGVYLANFAGSFPNRAFLERPKARLWADVALGVLLLLLALAL